MKVATKKVKSTVEFEQDDTHIRIEDNGDVLVSISGSSLWAVGESEVADFNAVLRAYLAHIDGGDA